MRKNWFRGGGKNDTGGVTSNNANGGQNTGQSPNGTAMGRYVEEEVDVPGGILGYNNNLFQLTDGSLLLSDIMFYHSNDNGGTWEMENREWYDRMFAEHTYIMSMAVGSDNTAAVIYDDETDSQVQEEDGTEEEDGLHPRLLVIKPDGTEIPVDVPVTEDDVYIQNVWISDTGRIFVSTLGDGLYEVYEDGRCELFLKLDSRYPYLIQFQGDLMIADSYQLDAPVIYDMDKRDYIEDEVLRDFVRNNYPNRNGSSGDWYDMYFFMGEEDVLYLAGEKGLHRHVIGGSVVEQVIDGTLCTFGNPAYDVIRMLPLENNEFLTLFNNGKLVHYVYNPDIPTVPEERLKVYSLYDNDTMRQAISLYQIANPEVFVEYEVGIREGDSITREDALKKLNTEIMAGEGADLLVLDNMPLASYIEKGLLLDLRPTLDSMDGENALFPNIVKAMAQDDKVYAMPCEIKMPVMFGEKEEISKADDLAGIADLIEGLRKENPGQDLLGVCSERGILYLFSMISAPSWMTENGEIDMGAIGEFLTLTKRIYDAQVDGLPAELIENYNGKQHYYMQGKGIVYTDERTSMEVLGYAAGNSRIVCGVSYESWGYSQMNSVEKIKGFENSGWIPMNGQSSNVFCAETLIGINAASNSEERARDFIKVCLGKENQSSLYNGYPVNQKAFDEIFETDENGVEAGEVFGASSYSTNDGIYFDMDIYWPDEEQTARLRNCIEAADTPYIEDTVLEEAVYEEGIGYLQGLQSLEETINAIEKKIAIYMAE